MQAVVNNQVILAALWTVSVVGGWLAWRYFARMSYQLTTRFRFYTLRDRCVDLVARGIVDEENRSFQIIYSRINTLAGDIGALDFRKFFKDLNEAVKNVHKEEVARFRKDIEQQPVEFQQLVKDFYEAIWVSVVDSSTMLQAIVLLASFARLFHIKVDDAEVSVPPKVVKSQPHRVYGLSYASPGDHALKNRLSVLRPFLKNEKLDDVADRYYVSEKARIYLDATVSA